MFRIRIRIQAFCWIRIQIQAVAESGSNPDPDSKPLIYVILTPYKGHSGSRWSLYPTTENSLKIKLKYLIFYIFRVKISACLDPDSLIHLNPDPDEITIKHRYNQDSLCFFTFQTSFFYHRISGTRHMSTDVLSESVNNFCVYRKKIYDCRSPFRTNKC